MSRLMRTQALGAVLTGASADATQRGHSLSDVKVMAK